MSAPPEMLQRLVALLSRRATIVLRFTTREGGEGAAMGLLSVVDGTSVRVSWARDNYIVPLSRVTGVDELRDQRPGGGGVEP